MIRVTSVTAKGPRAALWPRRESRAPVPSKQRDPAGQAASLHRGETRCRRVRGAAEASLLVNGGRYL